MEKTIVWPRKQREFVHWVADSSSNAACGADDDKISLRSGPCDKVYELTRLPSSSAPKIINLGDDLMGLE